MHPGAIIGKNEDSKKQVGLRVYVLFLTKYHKFVGKWQDKGRGLNLSF